MSLHLIVALAVMGAGDAAREASGDALRHFDGTWQLVSAITDDKPTAADVVGKIRIVIKDGKHSVFVGDKTIAKQIPFAVDVTRTPHEATDTLPDGKRSSLLVRRQAD